MNRHIKSEYFLQQIRPQYPSWCHTASMLTVFNVLFQQDVTQQEFAEMLYRDKNTVLGMGDSEDSYARFLAQKISYSYPVKLRANNFGNASVAVNYEYLLKCHNYEGDTLILSKLNHPDSKHVWNSITSLLGHSHIGIVNHIENHFLCICGYAEYDDYYEQFRGSKDTKRRFLLYSDSSVFENGGLPLQAINFEDFYRVYNFAYNYGMIVLTKDIKIAQYRMFMESTITRNNDFHMIGFSKNMMKKLHIDVGDEIQVAQSDRVFKAKVVDLDDNIPEMIRNCEYDSRYGDSIIQFPGDLRNRLDLGCLSTQPVFSYEFSENTLKIIILKPEIKD